MRRSRHEVAEVTSRGGGGHVAAVLTLDSEPYFLSGTVAAPAITMFSMALGEVGVREGGKLVRTQASKLEQGRSREMEKR